MHRYTHYTDTGFPDITEIPTSWKMGVVKNLFHIVCGATPSEHESNWDGDIPWVGPADMPMFGAIGCGKRSLSTTGYNSCGTTMVPQNSIVLSTRAPIGKICIAENELCTNQGCKCLVPKGNCSTKYYAYYLFTILDRLQEDGTGTTFKELSTSNLKQEPMPIIPYDEQVAIAAYLDRKVSHIDSIIAEAKASIEEYKAWKASIIYEAVTKGLNPNAEMKDSGVEWIERIPAHWNVKQIRYLFELRNERNDKPLNEVNLISLYTDKGVLQHCDIENTTGNKAMTADGYKLVYIDDIVVNIILCWMGAIGISKYNGVTSPAYDVYMPIDKATVLSRYYHFLFRTTRFSGKCYTEGRGIMAMRWRTYSDEFRAIKVPVPPIDEQIKIAEYIEEKCMQIDSIISEKNALVLKLEAYKKSLIFEVVTGKRKVV